ncbi:hypothetical protein [Actinopolymorpha singaporensis]|uniref:Ppx/GppA phosphatase family protein n=1 Tax=Actinopolymorpha singaporensis TaxID=117157 RepID=UPI003BB1B564
MPALSRRPRARGGTGSEPARGRGAGAVAGLGGGGTPASRWPAGTRGSRGLRHQLHPAAGRRHHHRAGDGNPPSARTGPPAGDRPAREGVDRTGRLSEQALARTFAACERYAERIRELGADQVRFVATSASRDADNRAEFVTGIRRSSVSNPR